MARPTIDISKLDFSNYTAKVELIGVRRFEFRIRLGMLFIRLGVRIMGLRFEFVE